MTTSCTFSAEYGRWWVLATYSLVAALQGGVWSLPGTLEPALINVYGISNDTVQLLLNYGAIFYMLVALPTMWALDRFGIRRVTFIGTLLMFSSNVLRLFARDGNIPSLVALHLSYILCAIAGPIAMAVPCKLAEDFFLPSQRTTATAIAALANQSGSGFVYLLVPFLSPGINRSDLLHMDISLTAVSGIAVVMFLIYFPAHPLVPPSRSALEAKKSEETVTLSTLATAVLTLSRNIPFVMLTVAYSLTIGLLNCTGAMLTGNIAPMGGSSSDSGWMGSTANMSSLAVGVMIASVADYLKARAPAGTIRGVLVGLFILAGAAFAVFALCIDTTAIMVTFQGRDRLYTAAAAYVVANVAIAAWIPLAFDMAGEYTFPAPEGTMLMIITLSMNAVSFIFLLMPSSSFFSWANYGVVGMCLLSAAALSFTLPSNLPRWEFDAIAKEGDGDDVADSLLHDEDHEKLINWGSLNT